MNVGDAVTVHFHGNDYTGVVTAASRSRVSVSYEDSAGDTREVKLPVEKVYPAGTEGS